MLKSHERFYASNGKRLILIADDEMINRELLRAALENEFEILIAEDGEEALRLAQEKRQTLSLLLLDLIMPRLTGQEVLRQLKADPETARIPVIVLTADQGAEVECLKLGAIDFIPKPYPQMRVIQARVQRTIELSEDRQILQSTERDPLTGLYNPEFFYRYAEQYDQFHPEQPMDALVLDICHFRILNERYGKAFGDGVLRRMGGALRQMAQASGGIVCRREADTFMAYLPHQADPQALASQAAEGVQGDPGENHIRLRMGIYPLVDKGIDVERRFDRAKSAADTVRQSYGKAIGFYDDELHRRELYAEQLLEDFHRAIREEQFVVYYQPKFDIRPEAPVLTSAEALVRWQHPTQGLISPGIFIPLFEENGLIHELDTYVWNRAAAQIRLWREQLGFAVPVSVNVSRIDLYNPTLVGQLQALVEAHGIEPRELLLEITESAYTGDSAQIIETVRRLRALGFRVEMDDFGTGYSSLNMISALPIDALKLDMRFIREAFKGERDTRLIEVIIDIADYLRVPVVAEGVETAEQLTSLRELGCALVQGYYFSKPIPADAFTAFARENRRWRETIHGLSGAASVPGSLSERAATFTAIARALASDYFCVYDVDTRTGRFVEYASDNAYAELDIERGDEDFFELTQRNIGLVVHPDDQEQTRAALTKENILRELEHSGSFTLTYRLMLGGKPTYVNLKATRMMDDRDPHIVIGVSNIDAQIARERELAHVRELANRDQLTGVKSKHAYSSREQELNAQIADGAAPPFAVAMCDLNYLKETNDRHGHEAGDALIKDAAMEICAVFDHSPVFRYGGDEFVVIMTGRDYAARHEKLAAMAALNEEQLPLAAGTIVACGLADFDPAADRELADVFRRADEQMYRDKARLKKARAALGISAP